MGVDDIEVTPPSIRRIARCRTPDCPAKNQPFEVVLYENHGDPKYVAVCGQCGDTITDLREIGPAT
ncbi:hypothetical protein ACIQU6_09635 [Streptomyces sp. NPDC090442]|uniref:hypothetical protein n=1 Tax=Streptomyces sp. NPDC090442 TaxID=3365962 RepID=UPI003827C261